MNPLKQYTIILFTIFNLVFVGSSFAKEIFVSNSNVTAGDGSLLNPYNTIQQAADVAVSGDIISIRAGVYREEVKMLVDGITYRSYLGEKVVINGTEQLKDWLPVAGGTVYQTKMKFDAPGSRVLNFPTNQLFVDEKMIELARWPNQTSANISIPSHASFDEVSVAGTRGVFRNYGIIKDMEFDEPDGRWIGASIWINLSNGSLDGVGWAGVVIATDRAAHTITYDFREPPRLGNQPWAVRPGTEYYLYNPTKAGVEATGGVNALVDPGEWLKLDSTVYVNLPNLGIPNTTSLGVNIVEAKKREFAFRSSSDTENRSNYTIKDINLFASTITTNIRFMQGYKTIIEDANFVTLQGIKAKYLSHFTETGGFGGENTYGRSGIVVSGRNCVIKDCDIEFSAAQGISLLGEGNKAFNNVLKSVNYIVSNAGALCTGSICMDCEVAYNTISNTSHIGINFAGLINSDGKNKGIARIHHNKLFDFMLRTNDSGGINDVSTFGNWARLDHNVMYKTFNTKRSDQDVYGLYFDYNEGSYLVDHNLIYGMKQAMLINKSKNMSIYNNTFLSNTATEQGIIDAVGGDGLSDTIRNNILSGAHKQPCCTFVNLFNSVTQNNIVNAFGSVQNDLFVNPAAGNFQLKSTAENAIDKGLNIYQFNDPIVGSTVDLGAFEFGVPAWSAGPTKLLPPTIIPNSGEFLDEAIISFKSDTTGPGVSIRYTLNGSEPTINSPLYTQPVSIKDTTWIKARIFINLLPVGDVAASRVLVTTIANIPPISVLISKETGSYPVKTFVTFFSPNPEVRSIHYTLDGTEPTKNSPIASGGLIFITSTTTVKAIAFGKYISSPIKTSVITITGPVLTFSPEGGIINPNTKVILTAEPSFETKIYYTLDGSVPTALSTEYKTGLNITSTVTLKAIAINGTFVSEIKTAEFIAAVNIVVISPNGKSVKDEDISNITLTVENTSAKIYYTLDGSTPTQLSTLYNGQPIKLITSKKLTAIAYVNGIGGTASSATFTIIGPDVAITPVSGEFTSIFRVTITSVVGASIYYTIDGSTPTSTSTLYVNPFSITEPSTTVKAIAVRNGNVGGENSVFYTLAIEGRVILFPNPASGGQFNIKFNNPQKGHIIKVSLYDILGRLIFKKSVTMIDSILQEEAFDVPYLKTGTYIVKMKTVSAHLTDLLDEEVKLVVK